MTGAIAAAVMGATTGGGGGTGGTPGAMAWANIYGLGEGANAPLTFSGIGSGLSATITAVITGGATLLYVLNGAGMTYAGAFTVHDGDKLAWVVLSNATASGGVTVSANGSALDSFSYILKSGGGGGYL